MVLNVKFDVEPEGFASAAEIAPARISFRYSRQRSAMNALIWPRGCPFSQSTPRVTNLQ